MKGIANIAVACLVLVAPTVQADDAALARTGSLSGHLSRAWRVTCTDPVNVEITFTLSPEGRVIKGPEWSDPDDDLRRIAAANRAKSAVLSGQPYNDLPERLYNTPLRMTFDEVAACRGQR